MTEYAEWFRGWNEVVSWSPIRFIRDFFSDKDFKVIRVIKDFRDFNEKW